jgi:uncharacterized protein
MIIGLISDTHGLLRPEAVESLAGADMIIHAGDIGSRPLLSALRTIAPVVAVLGNNDDPGEWEDLPRFSTLRVEGVWILDIHEVALIQPEMRIPTPDIVVFGHSHRPASYIEGGIHYINPGAAGKRRFSLPISTARIQLDRGKWEVTFHNLLDERLLP